MAYFFTLIPFLLLIIVLFLMDSFSLVKWGKLFLCIGWGIICGIICLLIYSALTPSDIAETYFTPILEEFLKGLLLLYLVYKGKVFFIIDTIIYGVAIGGGFGLIENIFYIIANQLLDINAVLFTTLSTATIHIGTTALLAVLMHLVTVKGKNDILFYPIALVLPIALHLIYNLVTLQPHYVLIGSLFAMTLLIAIVVYIDKKNIEKWIEATMSSQIELLDSIKRNQLSGRGAKGYLKKIQNDFDTEHSTEMLRYITLFLELSIAAKGNLLLTESGLIIPKNPENEKKVRELKNLRKQMGKTSELSIDYIFHIDHIEKWIIDSLL